MSKFLSCLLCFLICSAGVSAQSLPRIKVGAILPLSGALSEYGTAARNGLEMAITEHPELFRGIEFIYEDSQYDGKMALASYQKLRAAGDVSLVYLWGYGPSQAVAPVAESYQLPVIAVSGALPTFATSRHILRFAFCMSGPAAILSEHLRSKGIKRFGVIKTDIAFTTEMYNEMLKNLRQGETIELIASVNPSDMEFRSIIGKIRQKNFDAVGVFLVSGQIAQFYRQMKQQGLQLRTFGTDLFDSVQENNLSGGAMTGAEFVAPYVAPQFLERYRRLKGNDLQVSSAAGSYEAASLIGKALNSSSGSPSAEEIVAALKQYGSSSTGAADYKWVDAGECTGFDVRNVMKRMEKDGPMVISNS